MEEHFEIMIDSLVKLIQDFSYDKEVEWVWLVGRTSSGSVCSCGMSLRLGGGIG